MPRGALRLLRRLAVLLQPQALEPRLTRTHAVEWATLHAVKSATSERKAARSSPRGRGRGPTGPKASPWECRAARGRQARPEEALHYCRSRAGAPCRRDVPRCAEMCRDVATFDLSGRTSSSCRALCASETSAPTRSEGIEGGGIEDLGGGSLELLRPWAGRPVAWASPWERRAARSRQARPEEPQEPSCGAAEAAL